MQNKANKTNNTEGKRLDPFLRGVKEGAAKRGVDKLASMVSLPMAEVINAKLQELHPNMVLTAPIVQSIMQAAIVLGMGELADFASPNIPGEMGQKAKLTALFMRKYAGEKIGADIVDLAVKFTPMIMAAFADISVQDLTDIQEAADEEEFTNEEQTSVDELFLSEDNEFFNTLVEEEEEAEELVEVPVQKRSKSKSS